VFIYLLLAIALIYVAFLIYDINMNNRIFQRKRIDEDTPKEQNSLKPFKY
jgi:hypothetical protein